MFRKTNFFRGIPFRFVPFRASEFALLRNSECLGKSAFLRGIMEIVPSLFHEIFLEQNSVPNPSRELVFDYEYLREFKRGWERNNSTE